MSASFQIKGMRELATQLQSLPAKIEMSVMRSALREGAKVIADEAKARAPVLTGRLRDSIRVSSRSKRGSVRYRVIAGGETKKRITKTASGVKVQYDNAYYARFVEFGTAAHAIGAKFAKALVLRANRRASAGTAKRWMRGEVLLEGVRHPGSQPRPFMRPALGKAQSAVEAVRDSIRRKLASGKLPQPGGPGGA